MFIDKRRFYKIWVFADRVNQQLHVPAHVMKYAYHMTRPEYALFQKYRRKYPTYKIFVVN